MDSSMGLLSAPVVRVNVIDSPPIDGFTPLIAVAVTDARSDDGDLVAQTHTSVVGRHLTNSPETDFVIGLFDTGASVHVVSHAAANSTGILAADLLATLEGRLHSRGVRTIEVLGGGVYYLLPGLDPRHGRALSFFKKHRYTQLPDERTNMVVDLSRCDLDVRDAPE